ncbi:MAG: protein-L-isoaspartate(D-aspartate) O-methyltransferase, partial [Planctomycetes bacterium]|nr:protein-L-isoaspartate(D-aspartate) O-methyltransferase [Planctomycetota bacterium]
MTMAGHRWFDDGFSDPPAPGPGPARASDRASMVERQLRARDIRDERVLAAFAKVPRERFVPPDQVAWAYADHPLQIGLGQTISQPYMVALMTQELRIGGEEKVLEVGTGSGYQAAILAELGARVFSVERIPELSEAAGRVLGGLGYGGVRLLVGDGTQGWPGEAPFDRIVVTAGSPSVPESLKAQLAEGGILAIPVGGDGWQDLRILARRGGRFDER